MEYLTWILFIAFSTVLQAQELITYDAPGGSKYSAHNDDFTVRVRNLGGEWLNLFEWKVQVNLDNVQDASMVSFDFSGKVEISVRKNNGTINDVKIRPLSFHIFPEINDNLITFSLDQPRNISHEVNGDKLHNLYVFANSILKEKADSNDPNVVYFSSGIHQPKDLPGDVFHIPLGKTEYIDGGAVLKAKLLVDHKRDVKIIGHAIIFQSERGVEIRHSQNVTINGSIFINPSHYTFYCGQSNGIIIRNIKSFSSKGWSDGIDLMSCSDVLINNVFMRNSDACISIYGHCWDFYGSARNYQIKNSTLWADIAPQTNIRLHGYAEAGGDTIENITFSNIDILKHDEDDLNYQGCIAIICSDNNLVRNIRVEDFQEGELFNFMMVYNEKYSGASGRGIENVLLKDIQYNGNSANPSVIQGHDKDCMVKDICIEVLKINGENIVNSSDRDIRISEFTDVLKF